MQSAAAELKERKELVESLGARVTQLQAVVKTSSADKEDSFAKTTAHLEERLHEIEATQTIVTLRAPIDGMVTAVLHHAGENVKQGDPVALITATQPENIVGYLREPFAVEPAPGQEVEVRRRDRNRSKGTAVVTRVGAAFEPIINPALHPAATPEVGVPVEVSVPATLKLRPGEIVNLIIKPDEPRKAVN